MASPVTGKLHLNSYNHPWILGNLCSIFVIHSSSSTSSVPPGAMIHSCSLLLPMPNHANDELPGSATKTQVNIELQNRSSD